MQDITTIIFIILLGIISFGMPISLLIYAIYKNPTSWKPILVGLLVFIIFSQILDATLYKIIHTINPHALDKTSNPFITALYVSLSSSIFQEVGRYLGFLYVLKKFRDWKDGIAFGIGHGGIESIFIGGIASISTLILVLLSHFGFLEIIDQIISISEPDKAGEIMNTKDVIDNQSSSIYFLITLERIFVFIIQIGLSLLVLYGVKNQKTIYLLYAIYAHTIVYYVPALLLRMNMSEYLQEGYLFIMAIIALIFIIKSKAMFARSEP